MIVMSVSPLANYWIAFAFMGTILAAASIQSVGGVQADALFWTKMSAADVQLDPTLMKFAFVFMVRPS